MNTRIVLLFTLLATLSCTSCSRQSEDILEGQAAVLAEGKQSIPELLKQYREAIERSPDDSDAHVLAGALYDRKESELLFRKALELNPANPLASLAYGRYLLRTGQEKEALDIFTTSLSGRGGQQLQLRQSAIQAAARLGHREKALQLAGDDPELRLSVIHAFLDANKSSDALAAWQELKLDNDKSARVLAVKGRLVFSNDQTRSEGVDLMMQAWLKEPGLKVHYERTFPVRSLAQILTDRRYPRFRDAAEIRKVLAQGIDLFPQEFWLYEVYWKTEFAQPKGDFSTERANVRSQADQLVARFARFPAGLDMAATGYTMADAPEEAQKLQKRLLAEFPYSPESVKLRRAEAYREKEPRRKVELMRKLIDDFPQFPHVYQAYFPALEEADAPAQELLKGAEEFITAEPHAFAVQRVAEAFMDKGIYLDRAEQWVDEKFDATAPIADASAGRLGATKARLLCLRGQYQEAERILLWCMNLEAQGYSNVDKGRARFYLGEVYEATGRLSEAVDMYAQGYAQSQHYFKTAGQKYQKLYAKVFGGTKGMSDYLEIRDGMYQAVNVQSGIERGTRINKPAPDFELLSIDGNKVKLSSLKGKVVILNFWATWCGPCNQELPHLQEFFEEVKADPGVALITVTTDENRALVSPFLRKHRYTFPVLFDEAARKSFGVRGIPATFVIDPKGAIQLRMIGFNPNEPFVPYLKSLVKQYRAKRG